MCLMTVWPWLILLLVIAAAVIWNLKVTARWRGGSLSAEAVTTARRQVRRAWVLLAGTTIVLVGIIISPLPGPGFSILGPIGLALIATEFVWAQRLRAVMMDRTAGLRDAADRIAARSSKWLVVPIVLGYWAAIGVVALYDPIPHEILWPMSSILFAPIFLWAYRTWRGPKPAKANSTTEHAKPQAPERG